MIEQIINNIPIELPIFFFTAGLGFFILAIIEILNYVRNRK